MWILVCLRLKCKLCAVLKPWTYLTIYTWLMQLYFLLERYTYCAEIQCFSLEYWIPALSFSLSQTPPQRGSRQDPGNRYRSHIKGKTCGKGARSGIKYSVKITFVCVCNLLVIKIHGIIFPMHYNETPKNPKKYFYSHIWIKVVLQGYPRCPDSHILSECHRLYDLDRCIVCKKKETNVSPSFHRYIWSSRKNTG